MRAEKREAGEWVQGSRQPQPRAGAAEPGQRGPTLHQPRRKAESRETWLLVCPSQSLAV